MSVQEYMTKFDDLTDRDIESDFFFFLV